MRERRRPADDGHAAAAGGIEQIGTPGILTLRFT
jgi:hypothetical protein